MMGIFEYVGTARQGGGVGVTTDEAAALRVGATLYWANDLDICMNYPPTDPVARPIGVGRFARLTTRDRRKPAGVVVDGGHVFDPARVHADLAAAQADYNAAVIAAVDRLWQLLEIALLVNGKGQA
jgi:hypothetical protein